MALFILSPLGRLILRARFWLFLHGQFWLAMHLSFIIKWVFVYIPVVALGGAYIREAILLWVIPSRAKKLAGQGKLDRAIVLMRRSVSAFTPLLGNRLLYFNRAYALGQMLDNARRTGEANAVWEDILKRPKIPTGFEANVRKRLANGLETLGNNDGAARQRALWEDRLDKAQERGDNNWSILFERANGANDAKSFPEAQALYERALSAPKAGFLPGQRSQIDAEISAKLALAAHSAGDAKRAESAARFAIEHTDHPFWRGHSFRALALALGDQNRLPEAIEASAQGIEALCQTGDKDAVLEARGTHAQFLSQIGQVRLALAECEAATREGSHNFRVVCHIAGECARLLGDFDSAREWLNQARRAPQVASPSAERLMQGLIDLENTGLEQAATYQHGEDRAQIAWDLLQRAKPNIVGFERVMLVAGASEATGLALLGKQDEARAMRERVEGQLPDYKGDTSTLITAWSWLARASMVLQDWNEAQRLWRLYLDSGWGRPVYRVNALCALGESLLYLGDKEGALQAWKEAISLDFDIADTGRARTLLESNC